MFASSETNRKPYGVKGKMLNWTRDFLSERSYIASVLSGIPQGNVLGPTLFISYINDLFDDINSDGLLFADDAKIFSHISSQEDALSLQSDIDLLDNWSNLWLLNFISINVTCYHYESSRISSTRNAIGFTLTN